MKHLSKITYLFLAITLSIGLMACSEDDDKSSKPAQNNNSNNNNGGNNGGQGYGEASITLSGAINDKKTGRAYISESSVAGLSTWQIAMHDVPQSYSLTLSLHQLNDSLSQPQAGEYDIGANNPNKDIFSVVYTHEVDDTANIKEYSTLTHNKSGTLKIKVSNETTVIGSFDCFVSSYNDMGVAVDTLNLEGEFEAVVDP